MSISIDHKKAYFITVRIFFAVMFGLFLAFQPFMVWTEGYQENYYTGLNIGFTFRDYLLKYPTEAYLPVLLLLAFAGMIFKWAIGWSAGFAMVLSTSIMTILHKQFSLSFIVSFIFFICFSIMMVQLSGHFQIRLKHRIWCSAFMLVWLVLDIMQDHGGFLNKNLPEA